MPGAYLNQPSCATQQVAMPWLGASKSKGIWQSQKPQNFQKESPTTSKNPRREKHKDQKAQVD